MNNGDTITAIATPAGEGGLGVIRISGPLSGMIALNLFRTSSGATLDALESHRVYFGAVNDGASPVDEVCLTYMKAPRSYTKEDTVEISCHGSPAVLRRVLKLVTSRGARMAEPGEFTKRAFLNGRIDLSQAEGVIDLIKSRSEGAARAAFGLMEGGLSARIESVREKLVRVLSHLEASIDFPDEDFQTATDAEIIATLDEAVRRMERLIQSYDGGKFLRHGINVAIIGKPNAGKSSLLNALLEEERAIVTHHPGTTRDLIKGEAELAGLNVELVDTAGLNPTPDEIEAEGIRRSLKAAEAADVLIGLFDGSRQWDEADARVISTLRQARHFVAAVNKADLCQKLDWPERDIAPIRISVRNATGIDALIAAVSTVAKSVPAQGHEEPVVTRLRHREIFCRIAEDLRRAKEELAVGREVAAAGVWDALEEIKRFTGESYTEEVLSSIFNEFCVGK
ncbi:MAG: tRNA uridine-5-carboxymethylaminomethyl(34) synthesis GTPase MnmE [Nitrospinae bacterium]|nr:tRNA uridine-5-carboxymethylaminomethyl(34) synthesis GTPase MnmE [Nitrospinota bacterium]